VQNLSGQIKGRVLPLLLPFINCTEAPLMQTTTSAEDFEALPLVYAFALLDSEVFETVKQSWQTTRRCGSDGVFITLSVSIHTITHTKVQAQSIYAYSMLS
jgi:hypothetical protein